jgi:hypothetical protein
MMAVASGCLAAITGRKSAIFAVSVISQSFRPHTHMLSNNHRATEKHRVFHRENNS